MGQVILFKKDTSGYDNLRRELEQNILEQKIECIGEPASLVSPEDITWVRYTDVCQILFGRPRSFWIANGEGLRKKPVKIREVTSSYGVKYDGYSFPEAVHVYSREDAVAIRERWDHFRREHGRDVQ